MRIIENVHTQSSNMTTMNQFAFRNHMCVSLYLKYVRDIRNTHTL